MSRKSNFLPGKHLHTEDKIVSKVITFQKLRTLVEAEIFKKPVYQGALNDKKVKEMIKSYIEHPERFQYKSKIVIGIVNKNFYIIDGQHRVEMIMNLCKNFYKYNKTLIVAYYHLNSHQEALDLFTEINIVSCKNQFYISLDCFSNCLLLCTLLRFR